jgi:preprotein translocase subunit SecE
MKLLNYLQEVRAELSRVTWPTRAKTWQMTVTVLTISLFVGLYVGGLDYLFTNLLGIILK